MFDALILAGSFIALVFNLPSRTDGDELFCFHFFLFSAALSWFIKPKRNVTNVPLGLILVLGILTTLLHLNNYPVRASLINLFSGIVFMKVVAERTTITTSKIAYTGIIFYVTSLIFIVLQYLKVENFYYPQFGEIAGASTMPWMLGSSTCLFYPFVFQKFRALALCLAFPLLVMSSSVTCVVVISILTVLMVSNKSRGLIIVASIFFVVTYLFTREFSLFTMDVQPKLHRFFAWIRSLKYMKDVLIGNGIGSWAHLGFLRMNGATPEHWRWAHNEFLQYYFEQGLFGLFLISTYVGLTLKKVWNNSTLRNSVLSIVLVSIMHPIFHFGRFLPIILVIFVLCELKLKSERILK